MTFILSESIGQLLCHMGLNLSSSDVMSDDWTGFIYLWQEYPRNTATSSVLYTPYYGLHDVDMGMLSLITWLRRFLLGFFMVKLSFPCI